MKETWFQRSLNTELCFKMYTWYINGAVMFMLFNENPAPPNAVYLVSLYINKS